MLIRCIVNNMFLYDKQYLFSKTDDLVSNVSTLHMFLHIDYMYLK